MASPAKSPAAQSPAARKASKLARAEAQRRMAARQSALRLMLPEASPQRIAQLARLESAEVWRGPSALVPSESVALVLTGLRDGSDNTKTGSMVQGWILQLARQPLPAHKFGDNAATCGDCPVKSACYAARGTAGMGLASVGRALLRGSYVRITEREAGALLWGRELRWGAYGDPAALPFELVEALSCKARAWTGYTHQWRSCDPRFARYMMASTETAEGTLEAQARGFRTFRVRPTLSAPKLASEFVCPASAEGGHKATCESCGMCNGTESRARSVVIVAHGSGASFYRKTFPVVS